MSVETEEQTAFNSFRQRIASLWRKALPAINVIRLLGRRRGFEGPRYQLVDVRLRMAVGDRLECDLPLWFELVLRIGVDIDLAIHVQPLPLPRPVPPEWCRVERLLRCFGISRITQLARKQETFGAGSYVTWP